MLGRTVRRRPPTVLFVVVLQVAGAALAACTAQPEPASTSSATSTVAPAVVASGTGGAGPAAGWRRVADIPTPRSEIATAASQQQGRIFVIGGAGGPDRVERYDPATDRWDRGADLPIGVDHAMAAAVEGLQSSAPQGVFVFGGYLAGGNATPRSFRFDPAAARWEEIAPMPGPRAAGAAVAASKRKARAVADPPAR